MTSSPVTVKLDIRSGALEIIAPEDSLAHVFEQIRSILPMMQALTEPEEELQGNATAYEKDETSSPKPKQTRAKPSVRRRVRSPRPSNGEGNQGPRLGAAYYKDFEPFDLGASDETEIKFSQFYKEKSPRKAQDKLLVSGYIAHKYLEKDHFTYDVAFQIMRTCGEESPPKNISSAAGKLIEENFIAKEDQGLRVKIQGIDQVEKKMINGDNAE